MLDGLLKHLKKNGHRVLVFSQMTRMLDIIQDYLHFRGYAYERLDGSVRGQERFVAVQQFSNDPESFVFLLSTRAGGVGLNLTSADTVIFFDSDFNPQADLQASARVHRIGQTKKVTVIRLLTRDSVEEIIMRRANRKLQLSEAVMKDDQAAAPAAASAPQTAAELVETLKFGMGKLMVDDDDDDNNNNNDRDAAKNDVVDFDKLLSGETGEDVDVNGPSSSSSSLSSSSSSYSPGGESSSSSSAKAIDPLSTANHESIYMFKVNLFYVFHSISPLIFLIAGIRL